MTQAPSTSTAARTASGAPMLEGSAWHAQVAAGGNVLEIDDLCIETTAGRRIITHVDLDLRPAEMLALVGESGSGKTTVGLTALGRIRPGLVHTGGTVTLYPSNSAEAAEMTGLDDRSARRLRGSRVSYIPQDPALSLNPSMRVGEQIREVLDIHGFGANRDERDERVRGVLREVGLPDDDAYQRRWPHQLSGGQQQRIGIAMASPCTRPAGARRAHHGPRRVDAGARARHDPRHDREEQRRRPLHHPRPRRRRRDCRPGGGDAAGRTRGGGPDRRGAAQPEAPVHEDAARRGPRPRRAQPHQPVRGDEAEGGRGGHRRTRCSRCAARPVRR
ncbi:Oligopeptide transport ATP-binding protein OppD [Eumeta japonica]|uniref:Oligopeptide transport ATP-binding protein OppD n=1 Tax=Eumeta variegata TaxID=151549 RepID=A0A4C1SAG7_EUMVA|nr:Oligopeptide transport ATP-binding protein OppD [Eumeta japonica]